MTASIASTRLDEETERRVEGGFLQKKRFTFNDPQPHWLTKNDPQPHWLTKKDWEATGD